MKIRVLIGDSDVEFKDLSPEMQQKYREKWTAIYADIVSKRVVEMINQGKTKKDILDYLLLDESVLNDKKRPN